MVRCTVLVALGRTDDILWMRCDMIMAGPRPVTTPTVPLDTWGVMRTILLMTLSICLSVGCLCPGPLVVL